MNKLNKEEAELSPEAKLEEMFQSTRSGTLAGASKGLRAFWPVALHWWIAEFRLAPHDRYGG